MKKKISKKQFNKEKKEAQLKAFMEHVEITFKGRKVKKETPKTITIDYGGVYLEEKKKGDRLKTFIIIGWVSNNEMKEFVMSFSEVVLARSFAKEFKKVYKNTRILQAIE